MCVPSGKACRYLANLGHREGRAFFEQISTSGDGFGTATKASSLYIQTKHQFLPLLSCRCISRACDCVGSSEGGKSHESI